MRDKQREGRSNRIVPLFVCRVLLDSYSQFTIRQFYDRVLSRNVGVLVTVGVVILLDLGGTVADVEVNIGGGGSKIDSSPITIGDVTGRDHIEHGGGETRHLHAENERIRAEIATIKQEMAELNRFVFGDNRLGVSSVREEIRGIRFWVISSTVITIIWVLYEIIGNAR